MRKFDILDPNTEIFQNHFIEASAGTGKTFTIEHLFIRLLTESSHSIILPEILAVTFTREAANEMKRRIRQQLLILNQQGNARTQEALALFDEIQIFTIHGFCHKMLCEYAFEAQAPLQSHAPDQGEYLGEMRKTIEDFFQTGSRAYASEISALTKQSGFDLNRLIQKILSSIEQKESVKNPPFPQFPPISQDELAHDIEKLLPRYKRLKLATCQAQIESFLRSIDAKNPHLLVEEPEWFFEKMIESNAKVKAPPLNTITLKNPLFFKTLETQLVPALTIWRDPSEMLKRIAAECRRRWQCKARRHDYLTFDDFIHQMRNALESPIFKERVQSRYKVVIVDEFQDTDPIQWEIFQQLFLKRHLVYLIGDPKQSIYGFRNADIYTYMQAAKQIGLENKVYLDTNFRSSPSLVNALNLLFTKRPDWMELPSLPGALNYYQVKAGRLEANLDTPPIVFFGAKGVIGKERSFPTKTLEEERLFPYIAREIIRLCDRVPLNEMVVLIKDRFHAQRLQLHLKRWKIPSSIKRAFNLNQSKGFLEMELFLKALHDPTSDRFVKAAMRCDGNNPFHELRALFDQQGLATCFYRYLREHLSDHIDENLRNEMLQTAELLIEYRFSTLSQLLHLMENLKSESPETNSHLKLREEGGKKQVAIMTTFASKGLEFDIVFALAMAYRHREALDREKNSEQMRQLYVSFTRAREKLYIPYIVETSRKGSMASLSPIEQFFEQEPEGIEWIEPIPIHPALDPSDALDIRPPPSVDLHFEKPFLTSFSSMTKPHHCAMLTTNFEMQDLNIKTPHTLPLGVDTGTVVHKIFERYFLDRKCSVAQIVCEELKSTHLEGWEEVMEKTIKKALQLELMPNFSFEKLQEKEAFPEMEFLFFEKGHFVKGFIDLVFKWNDAFYILDWKTNWIGPNDLSYTKERLDQVMEENDYFLQARLYAEAVTRYVKGFDTTSRYGGSYYVFIRGNRAVQIGTS